MGFVHSDANGINDLGQVVGTSYADVSEERHATIWTVVTLTVQEQLQVLTDLVQGLIDANVLEQEGNGLLGILAAALASVENDRPSATAQLNAFIRAVEGFISGGLLTAEQGQALIAAMQSIIDQLSP